MNKLPIDFYLRNNVVQIAKELLGKVICTRINGIITSGIIIETEAYEGISDKASHAYGGRRTERTVTMYNQGGCSYVYLCYGIHYLFNVVTNVKENPHAALIRGIKPLNGIEEILKRRNQQKLNPSLTIGPGKVTQALGIKKEHNNIDLQGNIIWIENQNIEVLEKNIVISKRIGIDYAKEDALLPYRFELINI